LGHGDSLLGPQHIRPRAEVRTKRPETRTSETERTARFQREQHLEAEQGHKDAEGDGDERRKDPPDVVVFLDADCRVASDTVRLLAAAAMETQRPVQGLNLCDPDPSGSVLQLVSGLAFRFKNLARTLGLVRLTGMFHLTGTGMALPWKLVEQAKLAHGNVVEDMQVGIDFALAGHPPLFYAGSSRR
jgi:Glycosyl transferase family group 2